MSERDPTYREIIEVLIVNLKTSLDLIECLKKNNKGEWCGEGHFTCNICEFRKSARGVIKRIESLM